MRMQIAMTLVAALSLAGCGGNNGAGNEASLQPAAAVVTLANAGETVNLAVGEELEVRLGGNVSINPPDDWRVRDTPASLAPAGSGAASDAPGAAGAGSTWSFRFRAVAPGRGDLSFDSGPSNKSFAVTVVTR